ELTPEEQKTLRLTDDEKARVAQIRAMDGLLGSSLKREPMEGLSEQELSRLFAKIDATQVSTPVKASPKQGGWAKWLFAGAPLLAAAAALTLFVFNTEQTSSVKELYVAPRAQEPSPAIKQEGAEMEQVPGGRAEPS